TQWIAEKLGPNVPPHFTAFHPDWKLLDKPRTPPATLTRARRIELANGLHYVYTGNVHDGEGGSTYAHTAITAARACSSATGTSSAPGGSPTPAPARGAGR